MDLGEFMPTLWCEGKFLLKIFIYHQLYKKIRIKIQI